MKYLVPLILFISFINKPLYASMFGEETVVLIDILSTTASQLNELEKLVSNTEKYTLKMQEYNELMTDHYYRAERVLYIAESLAARKEAVDLGDLNYAIRELKYSMSELRSLMKEYKLIQAEEVKTKHFTKRQTQINDKKLEVAKMQVKRSANAKNQARANQLTAQNTSLLYTQAVESNNTQLQILEKVSTTNRLLSEILEDKRFKQMQKQRAYGVKSE